MASWSLIWVKRTTSWLGGAGGGGSLAAKIGVRSPHWNFGDMPPQPQVSEQQQVAIVAYVRVVQEANAILYQPHRM